MDRFDYKIPAGVPYLSSGLIPGEAGKPVAWGSKTSLHIPRSMEIGRDITQLIVDPAKDNITVLSFAGIYVKYLQNGVYLISSETEDIRVVAQTGSIAIKIVISETEVFVIVDGVAVTINQEVETPVTMNISPSGDVLYDKVIYGFKESIDPLVYKLPKIIYSDNTRLMPLLSDKLYEPELKTSDDMIKVQDYNVISRKLAITNTTAAFFSDTTQIEKSLDAENWTSVDTIEVHGEDAMIFRSKDPDFALKFYDTDIKEFIVPGVSTSIDGEIYKVGDNIGSYFSNDCYLVKDGSLTIESSDMNSVSVFGYLEDDTLIGNDVEIDNSGVHMGKMHLYTFSADSSITLSGDEMYFAGIGINLDHQSTMNQLSGASEISYADEISHLQDGVSINSDNEYAILDLQWNV